jgi:segregation and condensation protein A
MELTLPADRKDFILRLERFEGPLDLLLYLIEKNKFKINEIEVCPIVDQYVEHIKRLRSLNIELAGEFLEMASYLIWLKSCVLLPVFNEDGDEAINPAQELMDMLIIYRAVKESATHLSEGPQLFRDRFPRGISVEERELPRLSLAALLQAIDAIKERTKHYIMKVDVRRYHIRDMMARLAAQLKKNDRFILHEAAKTGEKAEIISLFMAALELSKASIARILQNGLFEKIFIIRAEGESN